MGVIKIIDSVGNAVSHNYIFHRHTYIHTCVLKYIRTCIHRYISKFQVFTQRYEKRNPQGNQKGKVNGRNVTICEPEQTKERLRRKSRNSTSDL